MLSILKWEIVKVAIYKDKLVKFSDFNKKYGRILESNGIEYSYVNVQDEDFWSEISCCDAFIYRWNHHDGPTIHADIIIPIIEQYLHVPCFPDQKASWIFNDKIKEYYLLTRYGFPVAESYIFWSKEKALDWLDSRREFPIVFKLKRGAGSNNVILVKDKKDGAAIINRMFGAGVMSGCIPVYFF